jgi:signal transduction histidine kinase
MPLITASGHCLGTLCVIDRKASCLTDDQKAALVTLAQQVIANLELRLTKRELLFANRLKDDFLSNISHEIRTPMNAIAGFTDVLLCTKINKEQADILKVIKSSVDLLVTTINDILDYFNIETGKLALEQKTFDVRQCVTNAHGILKTNATRVPLNLNICDTVPRHIRGDKAKLSQVLTNLVSNALKFTLSGNVEIIVNMVSEATENYILKFSVIDTGLGIPTEKLGKIFEKFEQLQNDSIKPSGTGLDLTISKRIVEMHYGSINVEST